jgi:phosphate transport system protein
MSTPADLEMIKEKVISMAELAKSSLNVSIKAFLERDASLCDKVDEIERETDFKNLDVEDTCLKILSYNRLPEASFRYVSTSIDISDNFERIADIAAEIAGYIRRGLPKTLPKPSSGIAEMERIAEEMITMDLEALSKGINVSVKDIRKKERKIEDLYEMIYGNNASYIHLHPESFSDTMLLLSIALDLKRVSEIAKKVGNRTVYIVEGRRIWIE